MSTLTQLFASAFVIALIVLLSRWLTSSRDNRLPTVRGDKHVYPIRRPLRLAAGLTALFFTILPIWMRNDPDAWMLFVFTAGAFAGVWLTMGSVVLDGSGITLKSPGRSRTLQWTDIGEVYVRFKPQQAIDLRSGSQKLVIDSRFIALNHMLDEIKARTKIQPKTK